MKIEIIEERENPLLNRRELSFKVLHDAATPSRQEVRKKLIALLNAKKETVILDSFTSRYGLKESLGIARVYKSEARAREVESRFLIDKNLVVKKAEEKPKAEKPVKEEKKPKTTEEEAAAEEKQTPKAPEAKPADTAEKKPSPKKPEKEESKPKEK
jgi:small subunit ribosomal protein S24e